MQEFGERLKEERQRLGFTQAEFGKRVGVANTAQSRYEKGESSPDMGYWNAVANLGVDIAYVLAGWSRPQNAVSLDAARIAAGQAYKAAQALGGSLTVEKFEKLFVTLCDTTAAREEAAASSATEPEVTGVHKVVQKIGAGSHNVQIGHGQMVTSDAARKPTAPRKKKSG
ncbi:hypothetical protein C2U69_33055 [Cupriavidus pinatubonensis]|nr:hypothetical protein C2U69_33055 [Cupriavidus pinatubonensis]